ncbi:UDP-3-O-[3-hydroxymyristoyl] N-acetylglucosamine deacetylase [Candidatus Sumerlaeota bacterium]|nr:UDP-3-O-[3-hydroxymyristoyl] N-acetylglucosamine deacetylase [Candidatus Sumerlaeota bacterium]
MQRTIKKKVEYKSKGLHTGKDTHLAFLPAPPDSGVLFRRVDLPGNPVIPAQIDFFREMPFMCSCVSTENGAFVQLIEHLLACFHAFGVHNLIVELDNVEPPFEDGSASFIVSLIQEAGVQDQDAPEKVMALDKPLVYKKDDIELTAFPSDSFRVTFFASYPNPVVGNQSFSLEVTPESFLEEIAPARTFCFENDVELMIRNGLLKGADENSALVFGEQGLLRGTLRFPDEPVRHKIMDVIGDLYLLGAPVRAHVTAKKSGHFSHALFVKKWIMEMNSYE